MAWDAACDHLDLDESEIMDPTAQEENLIRTRCSQFHGQLKDIIQLLLFDVYGFQNIQNLRNPSQEHIDAAKAENRTLVQFLKGDEDPMRFVYSDPNDTQVKGTLFKNLIFQSAINFHWFG
ncbi:hypothetical protein IW261DRAFT_1571975 [Armillaria novae-zelandiae]|uniref:DUF6532 domain-containing protein n=1 Tax=Armillaria novae-zelandiae TaxID=153914 RepID=A0AA39NT99_9AGAR|nr:hypothetical protein IW261DRAFT_1571975 [Armillaria novae-zelandiae]